MYGRRRHRWTFWFLVWFFGTLAVMVGGLVIEQLVAPSSSSPLSESPTEPGASPSASAPVRAASPSAGPVSGGPTNGRSALTGPVQVVPGKQDINGVELGFPHSTVGAVSAADADAAEVFSTLDPDRAAAVMRMTTDPSWTNAPQMAAGGAVNNRKALGLPTSGPVPAGASQQLEPAEYQVRGTAPDQVLVLLLCDFNATASGQGTTTRIAVLPFQMHWAEGDWKVQSVNATSAELDLAAEPDSPQAADNGWQQLEPAGG